MKKENHIKTVELQKVSKRFSMDYKVRRSALMHVKKLFSTNSKKEIVAIENVSFVLYAGETLGIIGKNGSGKSTLLKIIANIIKPSSGQIITNGKLTYITNINQGLSQDLTMRDNIYLVSSIIGLRQKEIEMNLEKIIDFSGLRDFLDTKIYQFSSGMIFRLSFSIIIHCIDQQKPNILLLDEVLTGGGGDIDFQEKVSCKIKELIRGDATVILVSHNLNVLAQYCDKIIWLEKGQIKNYGIPNEVIEEYKKSKLQNCT